jgi:hypothetical protein
MKKVLTIFFATLGVIFFVLILAGVYLFVFDPFNIKPLFQLVSSQHTIVAPQQSTTNTKNDKLSPAQKEVLIKIGIDPAKIPTSITPAQEACFVQVIGASRVSEIKAGGVPTPTELLSAKSCL